MINRIAEHYEFRRTEGTPIITTLGVISGEILTDLEQHGSSTVRRLIRELSWPMPLVVMAIGALVREGLISASQHDLEIVIELRREWQVPGIASGQARPESWGGAR